MLIFLKRGIVFFLLLVNIGCGSLSSKKPVFNPILQDKQFQNFFKTHRIKIVGPASSTSVEKIEALKNLKD